MIDLDKPIHTHVVTARTILEEMLKNKGERAKFFGLQPKEVMTVNHDFGNFMMTYDDIQDYLAVRRLRGGEL